MVGEGNTTMPRHQPASNVTKLVVDGVNKTIAAVVGVLGDVTKDVVQHILHPSPHNAAFPAHGEENGDHPVMPHPGIHDSATPPFTPSEVRQIIKVVFAWVFSIGME